MSYLRSPLRVLNQFVHRQFDLRMVDQDGPAMNLGISYGVEDFPPSVSPPAHLLNHRRHQAERQLPVSKEDGTVVAVAIRLQ